jgi:hypothetical protein
MKRKYKIFATHLHGSLLGGDGMYERRRCFLQTGRASALQDGRRGYGPGYGLA